MFFIILEKNLITEQASVHSIYEDRKFAEIGLNWLISANSGEDTFAYKMIMAGDIV